MGYRDLVLFVGYNEIGNSLKSNPGRVKEYIDFSCSQKVYSHLQVSWCTHFAHWLVDQAGMKGKVPKVPLGNRSTGRMFEAFRTTSDPRPGDLYYMPVVGGKTTHHIGIVSRVYANEIESLDGNAGDWRDPRTNWTSPYGGGIGGGMVCLNVRKRKEIKSFLELTPDSF